MTPTSFLPDVGAIERLPVLSRTGSVRVIHICALPEDTQGDTVIVVDRSHPVLGNRHVLKEKLDHEERARVIAAYRSDMDADFAVGGPMSKAVADIAAKVLAGQDVALACHCAPLPCHGDVIAERVRDLVAVRNSRSFHRDGVVPDDGTTFVFGSNLAGRHGKGAALLACDRFGARRGIGYGPTGKSYAIPTKDANLESLPIETIRRYVADFLTYARLYASQKFFVSRVGCGLAGYTDAEIAPLFSGAPLNCSFADSWWPFLSLPAVSLPTYAGIGSRETPPEILRLMSRVAMRLADRGYVLRSGGAAGADAAFEAGSGFASEIYLPWRGFNDHESPLFEPTADAFKLAANLHPNWSRLDERSRCLMARNGHQVLGLDLRSPVDFVVCWTPDGCETEAQRGHRTGGTGQAIALANRHDIPVFNLANPDALERIKARLDEVVDGGPALPASLRPAVNSLLDAFPGARVAYVRTFPSSHVKDAHALACQAHPA